MYNPQLETFLAVVESGSFNKAAERLYISPPAVIKQINLLEKSLDLQLFVRTHRGLRLTKAGHSLYQDAKYIIQYCKDSVTRARNAMQESESVIRIGTSPMTPAQVLVDLWPRVQAYCPGVKFQLIPFDNTPENAREILGNLGRTSTWWRAFSMKPCWACASAPGWSSPGSPSAARCPSTTGWPRRTVSPSRTFTASG